MATDAEDKPVVEDQDDVKSDDSDAPDDSDEPMEVVLENGGIIKKIITKGEGWEKPPDGAECHVHYVGTLEDGTKFDSSRDRDQPFTFKVGQGSVIKGWDKGVATMKKGEKALLICKPEYAYGAAGSPPKIPPNSTLHFEVELLSFTSMEKVTDDGQVMKKVIVAGDGWKTPKDLGKVNAKIVGKLKNGTVFFKHEGDLDVSDASLPWGLAEGLLKAKKGQQLILYVQPGYGYGQTGNKQLGVPPNAELEYEVTVVDFTNAKDTWDMSKPEKVDHGIRLKESGNAMFKLGQYKRAKKQYEAVVKLYEFDKDLEPEIQTAVDKLKVESHSNAAACAYQEKDWVEAIKECNSALKVDSTHTKSFFRRAQAHGQNGDNDEAMRDLQHLREIIALKEEKGEAIGVDKVAVEKFAQSIKARLAHVEKKQRKLFGGFFSKLSLVSDEEVKKSQSQPKPMDEDSSDDEAPKDAAPVQPAATEPVVEQQEPAKAEPQATEEAPVAKEEAPVTQEAPKAESKAKGKGKKGTEASKQGSKKDTQTKEKAPSKKETTKAEAPAQPAEEPKKAEPKAKGKGEAKPKGKGKDTEAKVTEAPAHPEPAAEPKKEPAVEPKKEPAVEPKKEPAVEPKKETGDAQEAEKPKSAKKPAKTPNKAKEPAKVDAEPTKPEEPKVEAKAETAEPAKSPEKKAAPSEQKSAGKTKTPAKRKQ